ncbi:MAG: DUF523 domain-containing protein [Kiritimatiellae bacterium]|nr:DUF523 domain-containing protein [Kiritimatiellia bacterium]
MVASMPSPPSRDTSKPSSGPRSTPRLSSKTSKTDFPTSRALVSACLLGRASRYDGRHKLLPGLREALADAGFSVIPLCPEADAGLPVPRPPFDLFPAPDGSVRAIDRTGADLTPVLLRWIDSVLPSLREHPPALVVLKAKSPSCNLFPPSPPGLFARALRLAFPSAVFLDESSALPFLLSRGRH